MFLCKINVERTFKSALIALAVFANTPSRATDAELETPPDFTAHKVMITSGYCDVESIVSIRAVCKTWRTIADEQNIKHNPYFITSGFLNRAVENNNDEIKRLYAEITVLGQIQEMQFFQRIRVHVNLLSKTLDIDPLRNIQMLNLMTFQATTLRNPQQKEDAALVAPRFKAVRERFQQMPSERLQTQYFSKMALIFRELEDLDYAYMLLMRITPPSAIQLLMQFKQTDLSPNKDMSAIMVPTVIKNQQTRMQNYNMTSEKPQQEESAASGLMNIFRGIFNIFF